MQDTLRFLINKKNEVHNEYLTIKQKVVDKEQDIEEDRKKASKLEGQEREIDRAIELLKGELNADVNREAEGNKREYTEAIPEEPVKPRGGIEGKENIQGDDDVVRKSEEPTTDNKPQPANEEGRDIGAVDSEQNDGEEGDVPVDGDSRKE